MGLMRVSNNFNEIWTFDFKFTHISHFILKNAFMEVIFSSCFAVVNIPQIEKVWLRYQTDTCSIQYN